MASATPFSTDAGTSTRFASSSSTPASFRARPMQSTVWEQRGLGAAGDLRPPKLPSQLFRHSSLTRPSVQTSLVNRDHVVIRQSEPRPRHLQTVPGALCCRCRSAHARIRLQDARARLQGVPRYSSRRASIGWMRRPCRAGPIAAITPIVVISKTATGSSSAR
jgi:hypothetical protein